ncbi:MarR family winged helix-turn-helix transcriptional regulator [Streptomyces sp. MA5143a]|uniref:MarR family winged helix-turn-helix transcriptional regulator n=1 Tax=Streptomyces sp. MA5143a TaxID=2083010 RepID=UPI0011B23B25|nr:MarR family transcriptional regulator [Streptomyces sp. MA5143a]
MPGPIIPLIHRSIAAITNYVEHGLRAAGYDISPPRAGNVMRNLTPDGATIVDIARACGVSKQAVSRQAEALRALGYVVIETSASDRRLRIVKPTPKGLQTRHIADRLYEEFEADLEKRVGVADVAAFRRVMAAIQEIGEDTETTGE